MNLSPAAWIEAIEKYPGQTKGWLQLHQRVAALEQRLATLEKSPTHATLVCAHCGSANLTRTGTRQSPGPFGAIGLQDAIYRCEDCQQTSHIELPMPG